MAMEERHSCPRGRDEPSLSKNLNGNGMRSDEPYLGVGRHLESGGGVGTRALPPNLRFRKHLKSATPPPDSSGTCIHPALRQWTLPVSDLELEIQVGLMESHPISEIIVQLCFPIADFPEHILK